MANINLKYCSTKSDVITFLDSVFNINKETRLYYNKNRILKIFDVISFPLTIIFEKTYNDKIYSDSFYYHYSKKHNYPPKGAKRLSIISNEIKYDDFYSKEGHTKIKNNFIGSIILRPLKMASIGRSLFNPKKNKPYK